MKIIGAIAAAILADLATAFPADGGVAMREPSALVTRATNSKVDGLLFNIDGKTEYYAGTNSYWIGFLTNNADVDLIMGHLQTAGIKILRVWGFNDVTSTSNNVWFQSFSGSAPTINTGANGLQRLDYVVSSAEAHGIKLIINFVNNWTDYGGMAAYNTYYGITKVTDWYTNANAQAQYKKYINAVVSRYKTSTAIFAWELANEPRCNGCATSVITKWATTISAYIKSLDSTHMVTLGDEGFMNGGGDGSYPYTTGEGVDFIQNLAIKDLDFGTFHLYPESWGVSDNWGTPWVTNHAAACAAAKKPCLFEEYGVPSNHVAIESPWQTAALESVGVGADLFWQLGDTISIGQTSNDGNTIYYGSADWTGLVTNHIAAINAKYGGGGGGTTPPVSTPTPPTSTSTKPPTSTSPGGSVPLYGQCGGIGYTGPTTCASGRQNTQSG
ncbi:hypothetical protein V501_01476 [Pseudogymnoascus sp. VKM F-4519 (FW-2642)]|nr:hypothetical protein V501_01476 [Pseudogymnoascus sp. VKM F-4519 (FW-2642)]